MTPVGTGDPRQQVRSPLVVMSGLLARFPVFRGRGEPHPLHRD
jgi:hypothetical protein